MKLRVLNQIEFSSILFDSLFGLLLFFSLESFLEIKEPFHFALYLFSNLILIHWWLLFKSSDDTMNTEVSNSAVDILFGIIQIILIEFVILYSKSFSLVEVQLYTFLLLAVDLIWALIWRYVGKWQTKEISQIRSMEKELNININVNTKIMVCMLFLFAASFYLTREVVVVLYILVYALYIYLTFHKKLIDIKFF